MKNPLVKVNEGLKKIRKDKKGFSLIELIIVVAIMVALIAILAPQYLKYVEKSRIAADQTSLDEVVTAVKVYASDPDTTATYPLTVTMTYSDKTLTFASGTPSEITDTLGKDSFEIKSSAGQEALASGFTVTVAADTYAVTASPDYTTLGD